MSNLQWNEGMSVGVELIDNDHKVLIALITEVSDAIESGDSATNIEDIFQRLEEYVKQHFSREEHLMRKCNYPQLDEHIRQHRLFTDKIPELKEQLLSAETLRVAEEVNLFLINWLMNHIVGEDMSFAQSAFDTGCATVGQQKISWFRRLDHSLGNRLSLGQRIGLISLLPLLGMLVLSGVILWSSFTQYDNMQRLLGLNKVVQDINVLSHSLQAERGLTSGYIGSNYQQYLYALAEQRELTDTAGEAFDRRLRHLPDELLDEVASPRIKEVKGWAYRLDEQRTKVDEQRLSLFEVLEFYSGLIASLLDIPEAMVNVETESELAHNITAFTAIVQLREAVGLERALGVHAIEQGQFDEDEFLRYLRLIGEQHGFHKIIIQSASRVSDMDLDSLCEGQPNELELLMLEAVWEESLASLDSQQWFEVMSCKVDRLKLLSDSLVEDIEKHAVGETQRLKQQLYFTATVLLAIFFVTVFLSWLLNHSIIHPVRRITHAMSQLAKGYRDIRFTDKYADDELGEMVTAYEQCRRNLLRADIAAAVNFRQQGVELQHKSREKEHFETLASTDPLTGALNRRKFNEITSREIERFARHQEAFSVMMLDIDHFKAINDSYGHASGDAVLRAFFDTCQDNVRNVDVVARLGGEEFAILMPETDMRQASLLAERVRFAVSELVVPSEAGEITLTVSIGLCEWFSERFNSIEEMLECADRALYKAKNSGRDRVVLSDEGSS